MKEKIREIYTVATAHLDTSWLWTLEQTVSEFIPNTMRKNFELFRKYPEYKFNFEGSYRYELAKEYYPEEYEKLKEYVKTGNWNPCGACYENGDVNTPSPEALLRNILYGNGFFKKEFGIETNDIFLPDCFGFGRALPSIASHAGLTGFSTQKLSWGGAVDVPFDIGRWNGKDGNGLWCALKPGNYGGMLKALRTNPAYNKKARENEKKHSFPKTFVYHGIGDRGGAPIEFSVKNVVEALRKNSKKKTKVYSSSSNEFFDMLESMTDEEKAKLPVWNDEFLMTAHGTGSYTSRTVSKRWNRRSELLADAAERFCTASAACGISDYPQYALDTAWKKVIAHQFHDDITGTSFQKCYKRNWNDYVLAMNSFSTEYTAAVKAVVSKMNTSWVKGTAVAVSNPVQTSSVRRQTVSAVLPDGFAAEHIRVFDKDGNEVASQLETQNGKKTAVFAAAVESVGVAVYDVRESDCDSKITLGLTASEKLIENEFYAVRLDGNGDICSIFSKKLEKELLSSPIRMALLNDFYCFQWSAWEIKYKDVCGKPYAYPSKPQIKITESGSAKCTLEVTRQIGKSVFKQRISLDAEGEYVKIENETDWREECTLLKAQFSFAAKNENASYDIGIGSTKRGTNTERLYEVPAQRWADITDKSGSFGVSVLSDSRCGWDKPDSSTLRLTCMHTPMINHRWECSQHLLDMGLNRYSFAVFAHSGEPTQTPSAADEFCQPMQTFICEKHRGTLGKSFSFVKTNNDLVRITAVKKAQDSDETIVRVVETSGEKQSGVRLDFSNELESVCMVRGDEKKLAELDFDGSSFIFDIGANEIKSFAITFKKSRRAKAAQVQLDLPFNAVAVTANDNRAASTLPGSISLPFEIMPDSLLCGGVNYIFKKEGNSAVVCAGQQLQTGKKSKTLHLLMASLDGDRNAEFKVGDKTVEVKICDCFENVGAWDLVGLGETGKIKPEAQALTLTHIHKLDGDVIAKNFYLFHAELPADGDACVTLPNDNKLLVFAATVCEKDEAFAAASEHFDRLEKRDFDYTFSRYALSHSKEKSYEKLLDKYFDRTKVAQFHILNFNLVQSVGEIYYVLHILPDMITFPIHKKVMERKHRKTGKEDQ